MSPTDAGRPTVHTTHTVHVAAPADEIYALVADVTRWPYTFGPTVHAEVQWTDGVGERLRLWAFANGDVRTWTSRRSLDPDARHVGFEQEVPAAPVLSMGGEWRIEAVPSGTQVELLHHYTAATAEAEELIARAVEANSTAELAALKQAAELGAMYSGADGVVLDFVDEVDIDAGPEAVYEFLRDGAAWPRRLPHVARLELTEDVADLQLMVMDTATPDGSVHTTESVRVCRPEQWTIAYKQTVTPELMQAHVGRWTITPRRGGGVSASSRHVVVLRPEAIAELLGPGATLEQARAVVRARLGANSTTTLRHAKAFAEAAARGMAA